MGGVLISQARYDGTRLVYAVHQTLSSRVDGHFSGMYVGQGSTVITKHSTSVKANNPRHNYTDIMTKYTTDGSVKTHITLQF